MARNVFLMNQKLVSRWLPKRLATDHKNRGGRALIWAGSAKMPGAALLATRAASRMGAGYVYTTCFDILKFHPEAILWKKEDPSALTAALIGPGLGVNPRTRAALKWLRHQSQIPVVVDADALTVAAEKKLTPFPWHWVATPHTGELARFFGGSVSAADIDRNRLRFARLAQEKLGCTVVLKGYRTIVATPEVCVIIPTGNVALAKGGSGDVLAGMITGLLAQGLSPERAALVACYVHGWMADCWLRSGRDVLSLTPSDLIRGIPRALARMRADAGP
jgi:NAD(P)H-hydrate epimerase